METAIIIDAHIHTPFCRHGSKDSFQDYVNEGLRLGRKQMTFTEHFPLPVRIAEEAFIKECSLMVEEVPGYLQTVKEIQNQYKGRMKILRGFEVDYVEGKEQEIKKELDKFGKEIEDSILSVHFVLYEGQYYAIDCLDQFEALLAKVKSLTAVYEIYFRSVLKSVEADLGEYKPKRIGHPTLIRIFNQKYPLAYQNEGLFEAILDGVKERGMSLDYNAAGLRKPLCKETYPSGRFYEMAKEKGILMIPGSDAHEIGHMAVLDQLVK